MKLARRLFSGGFIAGLEISVKARAIEDRAESTARHRAKRLSKDRGIAASLCACDFLDQGCEPLIETLHEGDQPSSLYLVALVRHEKRPHTGFYSLHSPKRSTGRQSILAPLNADSHRDSRIKPVASYPDNTVAHRCGIWKRSAEGCAKRGAGGLMEMSAGGFRSTGCRAHRLRTRCTGMRAATFPGLVICKAIICVHSMKFSAFYRFRSLASRQDLRVVLWRCSNHALKGGGAQYASVVRANGRTTLPKLACQSN